MTSAPADRKLLLLARRKDRRRVAATWPLSHRKQREDGRRGSNGFSRLSGRKAGLEVLLDGEQGERVSRPCGT